MSKLSLLATFTSVVKGHHVYSSGAVIGKLLLCKLEPKNLFNDHGNALQVVKSGNEDQIIGHLLDSLAEKIATLMKQGFLKANKTEITG